jgi:hypothetical protein
MLREFMSQCIAWSIVAFAHNPAVISMQFDGCIYILVVCIQILSLLWKDDTERRLSGCTCQRGRHLTNCARSAKCLSAAAVLLWLLGLAASCNCPLTWQVEVLVPAKKQVSSRDVASL